MPIPLRPQNSQESKYLMDFSFLAQKVSGKQEIAPEDKDAALLLKVWASGRRDGDKLKVSSQEVKPQDFAYLKTSGLVSGEMESCVITERGKKLITVMTLGENNTFLRTRKQKSYTEIMASTNKRGKPGFRTA